MSQKIQMYGAEWCPYCVTLKKKLDSMGVTYEYTNVDEPGMRKEMNDRTDGNETIPVLFVGDEFKVNPSDEDLKRMLNDIETQGVAAANGAEKPAVRDVIMIGAGPANLAAAVYTSREDIDTLIIEKGVIGGLAALTDKIDNYPGFEEGIEGTELADKLQKQAERFGAEIELDEVQAITKGDDGVFALKTAMGEFKAHSVLIGTGSTWRKLGVPGEEEFYGRGIHNCATCDGAFYRDKSITVIGGGNSAAQEALFLTKFASHIDVLVRGDAWKASDVLVHEVESHPKITVHFNTVAEEFVGGEVDGVEKVTGIKINHNGEKSDLATDGAFVFIGLLPNTGFLSASDVELDEYGFVKTDSKLATNVEGVFCAGDVRSGATAQIASAVGEGAAAALSIRQYLETQKG